MIFKHCEGRSAEIELWKSERSSGLFNAYQELEVWKLLQKDVMIYWLLWNQIETRGSASSKKFGESEWPNVLPIPFWLAEERRRGRKRGNIKEITDYERPWRIGTENANLISFETLPRRSGGGVEQHLSDRWLGASGEALGTGACPWDRHEDAAAQLRNS